LLEEAQEVDSSFVYSDDDYIPKHLINARRDDSDIFSISDLNEIQKVTKAQYLKSKANKEELVAKMFYKD